MKHQIAVVLSKGRDAGPEQESMHDRVLAGLVSREDIQVAVVPHLYDLVPDGPSIEYLRAIQGDVIVLAWLYPRSSYWVLQANRIQGRLGATSSLAEDEAEDQTPAREEEGNSRQRTIWCFDLRTHRRPERYLQEIERLIARAVAPSPEAASAAAVSKPAAVEETARARWYPVVDFSRCTQCQECLNFCLFGVFSVDEEEHIVIELPDACRPGCPACARICPSGAIMFPEHQDPAIAGDPEKSLEGLKLDLSQIFSGASPAQIAQMERQRALKEQEARAAAEPKVKDGLDRLVDGLDDMEL